MRMSVLAAIMLIGGTNAALAASDDATLRNEQSHVIAFNYGIPTGSYSALL